MSTLKFEEILIEGVSLGEKTHYPNLKIEKDLHADLKLENIDEKLYFGYGKVDNILPYKIRESYDRNRKNIKVRAAVLESDGLKAIFLTEYGCRLWSLYDKKHNRELLFENPVLQFGNLAVLNAWFAGGVEWNIGFIGHNPFTCEKMFCEKVIDSETGSPVLRFYEYERIRGVVYEVDSYISEEYNQLMVRVRMKNPHNKEIPMYWWSNIAVPETIGSRTIVDADEAYVHSYEKGLAIEKIPYCKETDISYSAYQLRAADYFFRVPDEKQKFIAFLDANGEGLIQSSTKRLKGRKLFVWGMNTAGRRWQDFLSKSVTPYTEIQAGLARTQTECLPMPANAEWEWIESYGYMKADAEKIHSYDWNVAKEEVKNRLIDEKYLENELERTRKSIIGVKGELLQSGSGWAYIESVRRELNNESQLCEGILFDKGSVDAETLPWLELLKNGDFKIPKEPKRCGYMTQPEYIPMLESAIKKNGGTWFSHFHLGVCYYGNGMHDEAYKQFEISNQCEVNPYALSSIAHIELVRGNYQKACECITKAFKFDSGSYPLAKRVMDLLNEAQYYDKNIAFYNNLSEELKENGRLKFYLACAYLNTNNLDEVRKLIEQEFTVSDVKEGETSLYTLWMDYMKKVIEKNKEDYGEDIIEYIKKKYPVPKWMNFNCKS